MVGHAIDLDHTNEVCHATCRFLWYPEEDVEKVRKLYETSSEATFPYLLMEL